MFQFLSNVTRFLDCFLLEITNKTSDFCKVGWQHTESIVGSIICYCWKFTSLSSSKRILKIH